MTTPGNVIYFNFTNDPAEDKKNIYEMMSSGEMVLVNVKDAEVYGKSGPAFTVAKYHDFDDYDFALWNNPEKNPVDELINMNMFGFFVKASDLFYSKGPQSSESVLEPSHVFLRCEDDWYNIDFGRRFPFILNNGISFGVYNVIKHNMVVPNDWGEAEYAWEVLANTPLDQELPSMNGYMDPQTPQKQPRSQPLSPETPPNQSVARNLEQEFDNEVQLHRDINELLDYDDSSESDIELTSGSDEDYDDVHSDEEGSIVGGYAQDPDDGLTESDEEYEPSESGSESESESDEEFWNEKRQDVDGYWYTREEFYDYYGSDEAWENLDPNVYHQYRYDDQYRTWATKEEFYQHYGSDRVWKRMHPMKGLRRKALWDTYCWSIYLPKHLRSKFIKQMLQTYE